MERQSIRRVGRPTKPVPEPSPSVTIEVWDQRAYLPSAPKLVGRHEHVPGDWTIDTILQRFGIGRHLTVYRSAKGETRHVVC